MTRQLAIDRCPEGWAFTGFWEGLYHYAPLSDIDAFDEVPRDYIEVGVSFLDLVAEKMDVFKK